MLPLLVACLLAAPGSADAQRPGARADSSAVNQLMQALSPQYSTTYEVNRQVTKWSQDFKFGAGLGLMTLNNDTSFDVRHDSDRDTDTRDGTNSSTLTWFLIPHIPLTTNLNLNRRSVGSPGSRVETNQTDLQLSGKYHTVLLGIDHNLDGGGGYSRRTDLNVVGDGQSSTLDAGVNGHLNWKGNWSPSDPLTISGNYSENRGQKRLQLIAIDGSVEKRPSSSQSRNYGGNLNYVPTPWITATIQAAKASKRDEFFLAQYQALEQQVSGNSNVSGSVSFKRRTGRLLAAGPLVLSEMTADLSYATHNLTYQVRPDLASSGTSGDWDGKAKGVLFGSNFEANLSSDDSRLEPATSDTTVTYTHSLDGNVSRTLSNKISARFDWLLKSTQYFFQNFDPADRLDRDERKTKLQPSLTYTPNKRWSVTASYIRTGSRSIQLNAKRASQTRNDVNYSVDMAIRYQLSQRTAISQNYSIKAYYTTLDFNPSGNQLLTTQRIFTTVNSQITPRVKLTMEHRFTLQDSGPFSFGPSGERLFARSSRKYTQEMNSTMVYQVTPWGSLNVDSRFTRIDNDNLVSASRVTTRTLQLKEGFDVKREIGSGVSLNLNGYFYRGSATKSYWYINSNLTKDF